MGNIFQIANEILSDTLKSVVGENFIYTRGDYSFTFCGVIAYNSKVEQNVISGEIGSYSDVFSVILDTKNFLWDILGAPQQHDYITNSKNERFSVTKDIGAGFSLGVSTWRYCDAYKHRMRIFVRVEENAY